MSSSKLRSIGWWTLPSLAVAVLGIVHVPGPFTGDQSLYALAGQAILDGATMYRDFGDIKHPGVHGYYAVAQGLLGWALPSAEVAVRLFELGVLLGLGLFLQAVLRARLAVPALAAMAPIATAGAYYATATSWGLTQPEALPGPLLCVAAWLAAPRAGVAAGPARFVAAGALGATAIVFQGHMVAVPIVMLTVACVRGAGLRQAAPVVAGFFGLLGAFVLFFALQGAAGALWEVYLAYPLAAGQEVPAERQGFARFRDSLVSYLRAFGPLLLLAAGGLLRGRRIGRDTFAAQHALWGLTALVTLLLESRTSWPFHFLYLFVPTGVLAVYGVDALAQILRQRARAQRLVAVGAAALIVGALAPALAVKWTPTAAAVARHVASHGVGDFASYREAVDLRYRRIGEATAFLRDDAATPGPIYVFGDPLYYLLGDREQALVRNGWGWEVALRRHWEALPRTLQARRPAYVLVAADARPLIEARSPETLAWLASNFEVRQSDALGTWYADRER
ncbi:MAG: hypothetical protein H6704_28410 [Myxococcales bacterium]|nr:hypothetical protein [Myxococcales bacterium]